MLHLFLHIYIQKHAIFYVTNPKRQQALKPMDHFIQKMYNMRWNRCKVTKGEGKRDGVWVYLYILYHYLHLPFVWLQLVQQIFDVLHSIINTLLLLHQHVLKDKEKSKPLFLTYKEQGEILSFPVINNKNYNSSIWYLGIYNICTVGANNFIRDEVNSIFSLNI